MEFPKDINNIIVRKLDIETRRALGIYTKLNCPKDMQEKISSTFQNIKQFDKRTEVVLCQLPRKIDDYEFYKYTIIRFFDDNDPEIPSRPLLSSVQVLHIERDFLDHFNIINVDP